MLQVSDTDLNTDLYYNTNEYGNGRFCLFSVTAIAKHRAKYSSQISIFLSSTFSCIILFYVFLYFYSPFLFLDVVWKSFCVESVKKGNPPLPRKNSFVLFVLQTQIAHTRNIQPGMFFYNIDFLSNFC